MTKLEDYKAWNRQSTSERWRFRRMAREQSKCTHGEMAKIEARFQGTEARRRRIQTGKRLPNPYPAGARHDAWQDGAFRRGEV
jgi:hypothetical protein